MSSNPDNRVTELGRHLEVLPEDDPADGLEDDDAAAVSTVVRVRPVGSNGTTPQHPDGRKKAWQGGLRRMRSGDRSMVPQSNRTIVQHRTVVQPSDRTVVATPDRRKGFLGQIASSLFRNKTRAVARGSGDVTSRETAAMVRLQTELLHICLPLFYAEQDPVHILGITSAISGEGKTTAAWLVSNALAASSRRPVVLIECDWQRPTLSRDLELPASPGLAEYLAGTSDRSAIRHQLLPNLTVIPAGEGDRDAMTALAELGREDLRAGISDPDEMMILDLPSVLGSYYGTIAARLADSLLMVVRAGVTPSSYVTRACEELKHQRVEGIILNQVQTQIPGWLQHLL
jgi:protein-tyrosine kinase